eukprot:CAMPEP_0202707338 /NCGR_PEP_ID=MMETSP1385-20130828/19675_1 /ASSEMBLY_ACC=CAM_ASM_000861 /TAXON_ID=933848 /ORGANISM="Elphidium margaritaceum" /LENGTH=211 /DNA_ID=CAMNT_0049366035 /DNA_START=57 /DNA_END=692 /DNA_ORIENTATION=+
MMHRSHVSILLVMACLIDTISGLYWLLPAAREKCFLEEIPAETLVVVTYKSLEHQEINGRLFALIRDPFDNIVSEQALTESAGRVAFSSEHAGDHRICFGVQTNDRNDHAKEWKMEIHIDSGEHAHDYDKLARAEHLSSIEVELRRLNDKIRAIRNEQQYQKSREEEFRDTSEQTNYKVVLWSVIQTVVLVACGLFQIWHLKSFFASKKLV